MIYLDNLRILATFAVIFLHVAAVIVISSPIGSQNWWIANIYDSMVRWCVPVFVMISGALLLDDNKLENISIFYKKRANRILIPLLAWTIIFLFWRYLKGEIPNAKHLIKLVLLGKPYDHLWFLFMLSGLYIMNPFFYKIIKSSTRKQLIFLVCSTFIISAINVYYYGTSKLFINWFLYYVPYYFTGYLIHNTRIKLQKMVLTLVAITSFIATCLGCFLLSKYKGLGAGLYFYNYLSITVIPMSISIMFLLKKLQIPILGENLTKTISSLTFGIYLIHPMILDSLNLIGISSVSFNPIISVPILSIAVFSISIFMAYLISKCPYIRRII